MLKNEMTSLGS